jgi:FtsP/CotA-like multicopper oxidase with cupredoxin domain
MADVPAFNRRAFLKSAGAAGALGASAVGAKLLSTSSPAEAASGGATSAAPASRASLDADAHAGHVSASAPHAVARPGKGGFDPHAFLGNFDGGTVSRDTAGRTVREYSFDVQEKRIEVADGIFFDAWAYNGSVPGPTIRATEGDRVRITFHNTSGMPHGIHFHGIHESLQDGVPGQLEAAPGATVTYDFVAGPFGTHLYHCHSRPLTQHLHRGLYGAFIVDPRAGRPDAREMVMVMNAFDTNFDGENEIYAVNTVAFAYEDRPIEIERNELQRVHLVNLTEFDPVNSFHLHGNFFDLYRTGTSLRPHELTDIVTLGQAERHMLEFTYRTPGRFMFHAHQTKFNDLGWMGSFDVV